MSVSVGVFGATGYTGREAARLVAAHPSLSLQFTTGTGGGHLTHAAGLDRRADAYLLCLPHGISARYAARLRQAHPDACVVDLSGDLRLPDAATYRSWYGQEHAAPELLGQAPYGLTEIFRAQLAGARLIANPGCYATAVLLPLVPLLQASLVDPADIVVDAKSGATGAGRTLREDLLFCEVAEDIAAYAPGRTHRHVAEIEAVLETTSGASVQITFCPHLLPVKRGILASLHLRSTRSADEIAAVLGTFYADAPFVRVVATPPRLADVVLTNACHISVHAGAPGRVVVFSAIDNLLKGAAGQAVQNLNLALGLPETAGLPRAQE